MILSIQKLGQSSHASWFLLLLLLSCIKKWKEILKFPKLWLQIALVAFISMTTFIRTRLHQETINDGLSYMGCLFFTITVLMFNGFGELALIINRLPVFFKQRDLLCYPAWTFSLHIFVLGVPITLFECGIWVLMTYFVTGYAPEAQRSVTFFTLSCFLVESSLIVCRNWFLLLKFCAEQYIEFKICFHVLISSWLAWWACIYVCYIFAGFLDNTFCLCVHNRCQLHCSVQLQLYAKQWSLPTQWVLFCS
jgi:hypothetical protein